MKPALTKEYPFSADYYGYTLVTSADGTVTTRQYVTVGQPVNLSLFVNLNNTTGVIGDLIITSTNKLQLNGYLKVIKDRNDNEIYENGVWQITSTMPLLSALGTKEGYRYNATLIAGNI